MPKKAISAIDLTGKCKEDKKKMSHNIKCLMGCKSL